MGSLMLLIRFAQMKGKKSYVIKIAPPKDAKVLTYEHNMMASEVFWDYMIHGIKQFGL